MQYALAVWFYLPYGQNYNSGITFTTMCALSFGICFLLYTLIDVTPFRVLVGLSGPSPLFPDGLFRPSPLFADGVKFCKPWCGWKKMQVRRAERSEATLMFDQWGKTMRTKWNAHVSLAPLVHTVWVDAALWLLKSRCSNRAAQIALLKSRCSNRAAQIALLKLTRRLSPPFPFSPTDTLSIVQQEDAETGLITERPESPSNKGAGNYIMTNVGKGLGEVMYGKYGMNAMSKFDIVGSKLRHYTEHDGENLGYDDGVVLHDGHEGADQDRDWWALPSTAEWREAVVENGRLYERVEVLEGECEKNRISVGKFERRWLPKGGVPVAGDEDEDDRTTFGARGSDYESAENSAL